MGAAFAAGADAGRGKQSLVPARYEYGEDGSDRSSRAGGGIDSAQGAHASRSTICVGAGNHFLYAPRRLVRVSVCDNFLSRAGGYGIYARCENLMTANTMIEELDREYTPLKDKVRDLREYL